MARTKQGNRHQIARLMGDEYADAYMGTEKEGEEFSEIRICRDSVRKHRNRLAGECAKRKARKPAERGRVPVNEIVRLFGTGLGVMDISRTLGVNRSTVSRILRQQVGDRYLLGPDVASGKRKEGTCQRGHSMRKHGKKNAGKGRGRYCSECKRIRERKKVAA